MLDLSPGAWAGVVALSILVSLFVLWVVGFALDKRPGNRRQQDSANSESAFLFRDGRLADLDIGNAVLAQHRINDWADLRNWLRFRFSDLPQNLSSVTPGQSLTFSSDGNGPDASVTLTAQGATVRVSLRDPTPAGPAERHAALHLNLAFKDRNQALMEGPYPIWKTDHDGKIIWQNTASTMILPADGGQLSDLDNRPETADNLHSARVRVNGPGQADAKWFEIQTMRVGDENLHYAIDISKVIQAETAQREFVQTLTKTFANLTTGLAVFDRKQQLALFNPALVDLTALSAEFLSARPRLMGFFDKLRDQQVMPEPKNYASWRAQITDVIETASGGLYQETWNLPTGVTYRVTGRPHPDGAVAFLFEDISAEISLTRRFRAQLDLRQGVLDNLDDAVAVIAPNNVLMMCNKACTQLFGIDPDTSFAEMTLNDLVSICSRKYPHSDFWQDIQTRISHKDLPKPIRKSFVGSGGTMDCMISPISGGSSMICFSTQLATTQSLETPISS